MNKGIFEASCTLSAELFKMDSAFAFDAINKSKFRRVTRVDPNQASYAQMLRLRDR